MSIRFLRDRAIVLGALLLVLTALAAATVSLAQGPPPPAAGQEERVAAELQRIRERLRLTDEQVEQVRPILEEAAQKQRAIMERHGVGDREGARNMSREQRTAMMQEMRKVRQQTDEKLGAVLSEEQMLEYRKIQQERREQIQQRRQPGGGGRR